MIVVWFFLMMPRVCLQFVIVVFPDQTHLLFLCKIMVKKNHKYIYVSKDNTEMSFFFSIAAASIC